MMEIRQRWLEAGERFAVLGRRFQERYEGRTPDEVDERLHTAIGDAIGAVDEVLVAAGRALGDQAEELQDDAQRALASLRDALVVTFTDSTEEIEAAAERLRIGMAELAELEVRRPNDYGA
jgi:ElaB/YqjD/DUF883 family membrane-anchored ribosome-binding protein